MRMNDGDAFDYPGQSVLVIWAAPPELGAASFEAQHPGGGGGGGGGDEGSGNGATAART